MALKSEKKKFILVSIPKYINPDPISTVKIVRAHKKL